MEQPYMLIDREGELTLALTLVCKDECFGLDTRKDRRLTIA